MTRLCEIIERRDSEVSPLKIRCCLSSRRRDDILEGTTVHLASAVFRTHVHARDGGRGTVVT